MYTFLRSILFSFEPERVHSLSMNGLKFICSLPFGKMILAAIFKPKGKQLPANFLGITFPNRVGLGAGFDKNASYLNELEALGFGFVEIGTVTPLAQEGNDKPRLFRLPKDKALINRMGFNNEGVAAIKERLQEWEKKVKLDNLNAASSSKKPPSTPKNPGPSTPKPSTNPLSTSPQKTPTGSKKSPIAARNKLSRRSPHWMQKALTCWTRSGG